MAFHTTKESYCLYENVDRPQRTPKQQIQRSVIKHSKTDLPELRSICRRLGNKEPHRAGNTQGCRRNIPQPEKNKYETQPKEMHIRCGRRSIPRPRHQHARNQSLPREGGSGNEATITLNIERSSKPKREAGEFKQILWTTEAEKEFQNMKKMHNETANGNRAKAQRGVGNVSMCSKGSSKRSPTSRKGLAEGASLFRQSCLANPKN
ncbi:hypothetical protein Tco_0489402 [Tanacetum coccineum]